MNITSIHDRLDGWLLESPVSGDDLSLFRVLYACFALLTLWRSDYAAALPPASFSAWSTNSSVDAHTNRRVFVGESWAPRCLAVAIGVAVFSAGFLKLWGGW